MDTQRIVIPAAEEILNRYFPVHQYGFVALVDYMGGDELVERFARTSYQIGPEVRSLEQRRTLIRYLFRKRHTSPFEAAEIALHLGLPIFVMRQLVRHRTCAMNEFSQRYSPVPLLFYTPDREHLRRQSATNKQGRAEPVSSNCYDMFRDGSRIVRAEASVAYRDALTMDVTRELARINLPLSTYTYAYWKMDLKNFLHLVGLRSDPHAQQEIQDYSNIFAGIAKRVAPLTFDAFQDYQQTAVTFSQAEMRAIRLISNYHVSPIVWENLPQNAVRAVTETLEEEGMGKREIGEFLEKLKVRAKPSYDLDPADARDASFYQQLAENNAVEAAA